MSILKDIKSFFQYEKKGDKELLKEVLKNIHYEDGYVIIRNEKIKVKNIEDTVDVFLANIP